MSEILNRFKEVLTHKTLEKRAQQLTTPQDFIGAGKRWILDHAQEWGWTDLRQVEQWTYQATDEDVMNIINARYVGGWDQFVVDRQGAVTTAQRDLTQQAKDWLADLTWQEDRDEITELLNGMSPDQIKEKVNQHYDGGWEAFVKASGEVTAKRL